MYFSRVSRDSSVDIVTGYALDDRGVRVRIPVWSSFFLLHVVQTGSEDNPASYPMGTGGKTAGA
jgi:hypothetical protein